MHVLNALNFTESVDYYCNLNVFELKIASYSTKKATASSRFELDKTTTE